MKHWLVIFVLVDGKWIPGAEMQKAGWSPRAYATLEICEKRRDFAIDLVKRVGKAPTRHFCTRTPEAALEDLEKDATR